MLLVSSAPFALASKATIWSPLRLFCRRALATRNETLLPVEILRQTANQDRYWRKIPQWRNMSIEDFLSYKWQVASRPTKDNDAAHDEGKEYIPSRHMLSLRPSYAPSYPQLCRLILRGLATPRALSIKISLLKMSTTVYKRRPCPSA